MTPAEICGNTTLTSSGRGSFQLCTAAAKDANRHLHSTSLHGFTSVCISHQVLASVSQAGECGLRCKRGNKAEVQSPECIILIHWNQEVIEKHCWKNQPISLQGAGKNATGHSQKGKEGPGWKVKLWPTFCWGA